MGIWLPPHFAGDPPAGIELTDLIELPGAWIAIGQAGGDVLVTPLVTDGAGLRRAVPGDGAASAILTVLVTGTVGALTGDRYGPVIPIGGPERAMGVDQSNESVIVGERAVLKLFPRTRPGPQPGIDLPAHLAAVGFAEIPTPLGSIVWRGDTLIASAAAFVPGARDGWEWYVGDLEDACERGVWGSVDAHAVAVGGLVARLHRALATPSSVFATPVGWAGPDQVDAWRTAAGEMLEQALAATAGAEGARLRAIAPRARDVIEILDDVERTTVMRIHGDLHVGQVLRDDDGSLLVNDFDGNPLATGTRTMPDAPARDVAAMVCAIDHVGRVVARRRPADTDAIAAWAARSRAAFLDTYRDELGDRRDLFDDRLLGPLEVMQEAHEYVYAARYLPRWRYVPDGAMPAAVARWTANG